MMQTTQRDQYPLWLIDLDDTIFDASATMFTAIHDEMNRFISTNLNLSIQEAMALRSAYWRKYGATYEGMWRHHGIKPEVFLEQTHAFDLIPHVFTQGNPKAVLDQLKGRKILYTNSPRSYAERILKHLGLSEYFEAIFSSNDSCFMGQWRAKPSPIVLRHICRMFHVKPEQCIMVDDSLKNLLCAYQMGMKTAWVTGYRRAHDHGGEARSVSYVTWRVQHIRELLRLPVLPRTPLKLDRKAKIKQMR